jgi:phosphoglycolate phosphatase-like HAD superfamily hydrolase
MGERTLLFDLDGTLTDPFEGITRSMMRWPIRRPSLAPSSRKNCL